MEFTQKFREAVESFQTEAKTNLEELKYNVENTYKNAVSEGKEEVEILKNHFKAASERIQAKLKGPFTMEKVQSDLKEEADILVADVKTTFNRNRDRVNGLVGNFTQKANHVVKEVKKEVKTATSKAKTASKKAHA